MPVDSGVLGATSTRRLLFRGAIVIGLLTLMVTGGLAIGTPAHAGPHAAPPSSTRLLPSAATLLTQAGDSLATGIGPAGGTPASCSVSSALVSTCASTAPASPRPAISANGTWMNITSSLVGGASSGPSSRYIGAMTYDAFDGYVLLFGGATAAVYGDTWTYQSGVWTLLSPSVSPPARYAAMIAYDPAEQQVILFSGRSGTSTVINDTWAFSNGTWTQLTQSGPTPTPRWRGDLAYDSDAGYLMLTGGSDISGTTTFNDTWFFENDTWIDETNNVTGPIPSLYRGAMVYDAFDHEFVLFGGTTSSGAYVSQTWTFTNNDTWTELSLTTAPSARVYIFLVYDPLKDGVIMFGGDSVSGGGTLYSDTWFFQSGNWTQLTPAVSPNARGYGMIAFDPVGGYVLLFGGGDGIATFYGDTWTYGAAAVVWGNATPSAIDAGLTTTIHLTVVSALTNLSEWYLGLPRGCLSANTTALLCTPTSYGNYTVLGGVTDPGGGDNASANITLQIREDPTVTQISFSPRSVDVGVSTNISGRVAGGTPPFSYNWTKLPPGCSTSNASSISCTPSQVGSFPVELTVEDIAGVQGSRNTTLTVNSTPTIREFTSSPAAIDIGQTITLYANASAGTPPYGYVWTNLPVGCSPANASMIQCAPIAPGGYTVEAMVTDTFGKYVTGNISFQVNQNLQFGSVTASPTSVDVGATLTFYTNASLGTAPYSYTFQGVPTGCTPTNSKVSTCTPTKAGNYTVTAKVTDAAGATVSSHAIQVRVVPDPVITSFTATPGAADRGKTVVFTIVASLGSGLFSYAYTGLPTGCASANTASLSCTPAEAGQLTVVATVTDAQQISASAHLNLTVGAPPGVSLSISLPSINTGQTVTFTAQTSGGVAPFKFAYTGLPAGCQSANQTTLTCAPSATGTFSVTVTATDQAGVASQDTQTLTVKSPTSGSFLGLPLYAGIGIIVVVIAVVVAAAALLMRRRRPPPPAPEMETGPVDPDAPVG